MYGLANMSFSSSVRGSSQRNARSVNAYIPCVAENICVQMFKIRIALEDSMQEKLTQMVWGSKLCVLFLFSNYPLVRRSKMARKS